MMNIKCSKEYYDKVIENAKTIGRYDQLQKQLIYLTNYGFRKDDGTFEATRTRCDLYSDHCFPGEEPMNFTFVMHRQQDDGSYREWFNGGLIFFRSSKDWDVHT